MVVVLALVGGAGAAYRLGALDRWLTAPPDPVTEPAAVPPPEGIEVPELVEPAVVAEPAAAGALATAKVRRALAAGLRDRDLGRSVHAAVAGLSRTGEPAFSTGDGAFMPASTTKLLTTTAALDRLGPDHRFATTVVRRGRTLTLVGGGDPLLALRPDDRDGWPERADILTLARRTAQALPRSAKRRPVRLRYDAGLFTGPAENPFWRADYVPDDIVSPISALWVDEGRDPDGLGRVDDPAATAAAEFAAALGRQGVRVAGVPSPGRAGAAEEVARVESAPLSQLVEWALLVSDNEASEVLAHHVGLAVVGDGSFSGGARGVRRALADLGIPMAGAVLRDGSGLSRRNRLRPRTLIEVLRVAASEDHPELRSVITGLPVAGFTGSLAYRFDQAPDAGLGHVRAKTGTLTGVSALAGVATDQDGTPVAFVLAADRVRLRDTLDARQDLDNLAATIGACRCSR